MEHKLIVCKVSGEEIIAVTNISKRAFESDRKPDCDDVSGPPNYDSITWHAKMVAKNVLYAIKEENQIVGGFLVFKDRQNDKAMYLGRIFIDPDYHRLGYGRQVMAMIEEMFPTIKIWKLETPLWNERTKAFYQNIGYVEISRDSESIYYQKKID